MALPVKKLKALVDRDSKMKPFGKAPDHEDGGKPGQDHGGEDHEDDHEDEHEDHEIDAEKIALIEKMLGEGKGDKHLLDLASEVDDDHNPPEWVEDEETWDKAKKAVEDSGTEPDDLYALVTHVYKAMGGETK